MARLPRFVTARSRRDLLLMPSARALIVEASVAPTRILRQQRSPPRRVRIPAEPARPPAGARRQAVIVVAAALVVDGAAGVPRQAAQPPGRSTPTPEIRRRPPGARRPSRSRPPATW